MVIIAIMSLYDVNIKPLYKEIGRRNRAYDPQEAIRRESEQCFQKALQEGVVETCRLRIVVLGRGGVGKSSIVRALLGEKFTEKHIVTNSMEVKVAFAKMSKNREWMLSKEDKQLFKQEEYDIISRSIRNISKARQSGSGLAGHKSKDQELGRSGTSSKPEKGEVLQPDLRQSFSSKKRTKEELIPDEEYQSIKQRLQGEEQQSDPVLIWDFGGQALFYTVHQLFLTPDTIYLLLSDLSHDLDDPVEHDNRERGMPESCPRTERECLNYFMSTINLRTSSMKDDDRQNNEEWMKPSGPPHLFMVGTKTDLIENKAVQHKRLTNIESHVKSSHLGKVARGTVIPFSCKEPEALKRLRDRIQPYIQDFKKTLPVKWFRFRNILQKEAVHTWDEVLDIARDRLYFRNDDEVKDALTYFHDQRELVYFEALPEFIICQPNWLVERIREVITTEEYHQELQNQRRFDNLGWEFQSLKGDGLLYDHLATAIWKDNKKPLLEIMQKYLLLMPWREEEKRKKCYIIPSLRPRMSCCQDQPQLKEIPPLYFKPKSGFIPVGVTSRLITSLVLEKNRDIGKGIFCDGAIIYRKEVVPEVVVYLHETTLLNEAVLKVSVIYEELTGDVFKCLDSTTADIEEGIKKINKMINVEQVYEIVFESDCKHEFVTEAQLLRSKLRCRTCQRDFLTRGYRYWFEKFQPREGSISAKSTDRKSRAIGTPIDGAHRPDGEITPEEILQERLNQTEASLMSTVNVDAYFRARLRQCGVVDKGVDDQLKLQSRTDAEKVEALLDHVKRDPIKKVRGLLLALGATGQYRAVEEFDTQRVRSSVGFPPEGPPLRKLIEDECEKEYL